jgi:eukaryotic-like serine/threonine-protein kinase
VLEHVEGRPLQGPLAVDEALRLATEIAGALEEAHRRGILHCDLKPANIMVTAAGDAKLLDFGLAKLMDADVDATRTVEGTVVGTAAYMSPEQAEGKPLDARSDVFSFGAVLYEMLSGSRAFAGQSTLQVMNAVGRDEPVPLRAPPALVEIVRRCLQKRPDRRFQTMAEVRTALELERLASASGLRPLDQRPSIAVLPFADMSAGKDHEWFSDGLTEEIINALAQIPGLRVIARTSAFAFKEKLPRLNARTRWRRGTRAAWEYWPACESDAAMSMARSVSSSSSATAKVTAPRSVAQFATRSAMRAMPVRNGSRKRSSNAIPGCWSS